MKKSICFIVMFMLAFTVGLGTVASYAEQPEAFWSFEAAVGDTWKGENATLDVFEYQDEEKAAALTTYNMGWAGRFGGAAIKGERLNVKVSPEKNRYAVISIKTDGTSGENAYDALTVIYWKSGDGNPYWTTTPKDAAAAIHGASSDGYTKIIIDLAWTEEFLLETLRLDIMSSSIDAASSSVDGAPCGILYINYIALFDTKGEAEEFVYPAPPATDDQTPDNDPSSTTPPATGEQTPDNGSTNPSTGKNDIFVYAEVTAVLAASCVLFTRKRKKAD